MKVVIISALLLFTSITLSGKEKASIKLTNQEKLAITVDFLKGYDSKYSESRWKIKLKETKVVAHKRFSLTWLSLHDPFFERIESELVN